jgi:hypothetical protein
MKATPGTAKARLLATLAEITRSVEVLPESACVVLEEAQVIQWSHRHLQTMGHVVSVFRPVADSLTSLVSAVGTVRRAMPRRR